MDILTAKGQETRQQEERAIEIWLKHFPAYSYVQTPKDKPAIIDAILSVDGVMKAVVETKCRNTSVTEFHCSFKDEWLVTYEKLIKAADIASALSVPLIGFLYLIQDDVLLYQKLWEPNNGWTCHMSIKPTWTQATVNGGKALRSNAFIDMSKATSLRRE
jgi:hypothetical protein